MNFKERSYQPEFLDRDDISFEDIKRNMQELNFINTYLGGHTISINGLKEIIGEKKSVHVCEIGCGGGDNLIALNNYFKRKKVKLNFTGIDIKQACIDFAKMDKRLKDNTTFSVSDYKLISFSKKPGVIFSSLFCHHFKDEELIGQIKWMKENCTLGFFINDLQRNSLAYYLIKFFTKFFSRSYLVKNDAPLSVARSFTKSDWKNIFQKAGIENFSVTWKWAFRYLIVYKHAEQHS